MLYRFKVSNETQIRSVFVKVPLRNLTKNQTKGSVFEKPLLFPKTEPIDMPRLQYSALSAIHEYITGLGNNQLGAIWVLDYLPNTKQSLLRIRATQASSTFFKRKPVSFPIYLW